MNREDTIQTIFKYMLKTRLMEEAKVTTQIMFAFIFIALLSKVLFSGVNTNHSGVSHGNNGEASINIMSYSIILISITTIVILNVMLNSDIQNSGIFKIISWDMIVLVIFLLWLISINLNHYERINTGKVPDNYYIYANLSILVIAGQSFFFMFNYILINDERFKQSDLIKKYEDLFNRMDFIQYILMFLNFLLILIQQIILDHFSVDII